LAPFAALSGFSEIILHLAMLPFYVLLVLGMLSLSRRFGQAGWLPVLFLVGSAALIVSGNVMRDVPAGALLTAGAAAFVNGTDRGRGSWLLLGSSLVGLALLTKYSAASILPALIVYAGIKRSRGALLSLVIPFALLTGWCLHGWLFYGQAHPLYLLLKGGSSGITWYDKLFCGLAAVGAVLFLAPVRLFRPPRAVGSLILGLVAVVICYLFYQPGRDGEFLF
jgi:hypothetical protein